MSAQDSAEPDSHNRPSASHDSPSEGPGLLEIIGAWWRARTRIMLLGLAGVVIAAGVVSAVYLARPSQQEATVTVRLLFKGVQDGQYPNGMRFTPADIVATPVLEEVYRNNRLEKFVKFDDFKNAFAVINTNPALDRLRREYRDQLDARNLSAVDRSKLEDDFAAKVKALQNGEFTLVALLGGRFSSWPASLTGKIMDDILSVWVEQSRTRGVFKFDLNIYSDNILSDLSVPKGDYLVFLDRLRVTINRILANLDDLAAIPGANLLRVGEKQMSLQEMQVALQDDLRFKLDAIEAPVYAMGMYGNRSLAEAYLHEQIFRLQLETQEDKSSADAVAQALAGYNASRPGASAVEGAAAGGSAAMGGGTLIPQISESFLDRVLSLSSQNADVAFRQRLVQQSIDIQQSLGKVQSEQERYTRMLQLLAKSEAMTDSQGTDVEKWVEQQVAALLSNLADTIKYVQLLHEEVSQQNLQPSTVFTVVVPLSQDRVSVVSMTRIGLIVAMAFCVYLGSVLVIVAWRSTRDASRGSG